MKNSKAGRRSLKRYELGNLFFFLGIIAALAILVTFVFRYYGTRDEVSFDESEKGVISESLSEGSDIGVFYLDTKLSEVNLQYRSRIDIPSRDDGLVRDLFALPGVESVTINQKMIMIRKAASARWEGIRLGVRRIVKDHLHIHY